MSRFDLFVPFKPIFFFGKLGCFILFMLLSDSWLFSWVRSTLVVLSVLSVSYIIFRPYIVVLFEMSFPGLCGPSSELSTRSSSSSRALASSRTSFKRSSGVASVLKVFWRSKLASSVLLGDSSDMVNSSSNGFNSWYSFSVYCASSRGFSTFMGTRSLPIMLSGCINPTFWSNLVGLPWSSFDIVLFLLFWIYLSCSSWLPKSAGWVQSFCVCLSARLMLSKLVS